MCLYHWEKASELSRQKYIGKKDLQMLAKNQKNVIRGKEVSTIPLCKGVFHLTICRFTTMSYSKERLKENVSFLDMPGLYGLRMRANTPWI